MKRLDEKMFDNIEQHCPSIKLAVETALVSTDQDKITSDINHVKNIIETLTPRNITTKNRAIVLLFFLNGYSQHHAIELITVEVRGFLTSLSLTLLNDLDFDVIYKSETLHGLFNKLLLNYLRVCNELQTIRLLESFSRFKQQIPDDHTLRFFQMHTIKQLFNHQMYNDIVNLIKNFNIDDFDKLSDVELVQDHLFSYFHQLTYALIISKSYEEAYQIVHITMDLNLLVDVAEFQYMISEFVFLSMILNKDIDNSAVAIMKYKTKINPSLLRIYQYYQLSAYELFVHEFCLYIVQLQFKKQELLCEIFNYSTLNTLFHQIIDNRLGLFVEKLDTTYILEQERLVNKFIYEMNLQLSEHNSQLSEYKYRQTETYRLSHTLLLDDCQRLIKYNDP